MREAFGDAPPEEMVFCVLTLDAEFHDLRQHDLPTLYRQLGQRLEKFRKRLRRLLARYGLEPFKVEWVAVIEQHRSGVPHCNLLMHAPSWSRWLTERYAMKRRLGLSPRNARLLAGTARHCDDVDADFLQLLNACGFGHRSSAEVARNGDAAIGYIGKVAGHADATAAGVAKRLAREQGRVVGESAKSSQLPIRAPKGFRRLRSGVGFLPPRRKGDNTGMLIKRYRTSQGDEIARPLVVTQRADLVAMQDLLCATEQTLAWKDEDLRARALKLRGLRLPSKVKRRDLITQHRLDLRPHQVEGAEPPLHFARAGPGPPARERAGEQLELQPGPGGVCVGGSTL